MTTQEYIFTVIGCIALIVLIASHMWVMRRKDDE